GSVRLHARAVPPTTRRPALVDRVVGVEQPEPRIGENRVTLLRAARREMARHLPVQCGCNRRAHTVSDQGGSAAQVNVSVYSAPTSRATIASPTCEVLRLSLPRAARSAATA